MDYSALYNILSESYSNFMSQSSHLQQSEAEAQAASAAAAWAAKQHQ